MNTQVVLVILRGDATSGVDHAHELPCVSAAGNALSLQRRYCIVLPSVAVKVIVPEVLPPVDESMLKALTVDIVVSKTKSAEAACAELFAGSLSLMVTRIFAFATEIVPASATGGVHTAL